MTQDYSKRKAAKKAWKKQGSKSEEATFTDKAVKRDRKKRKTRSICQGLCFKDPVITEADKRWNGTVDDNSDEDVAQHVDSDLEEEVRAAQEKEKAQQEKKDRKKEKQKEKEKEKKRKKPSSDSGDDKKETKKPNGIVKLSTGVQLLDPSLAAQQATDKAAARDAAKAKTGGAAAADGKVVEAAALAPYPDLIRSHMLSQGFAEPTPIQERCWPLLLQGKDVLGVAEPGSGKTLAYLLPAVNTILAAGHGPSTSPDTPAILIILPTRELAQQVAAAARGLRKVAHGLRTVCLYGGVPKEQQVELLAKHPHIIVSTPGRLLDLVDDGSLKLTPPATQANTAATRVGEADGGNDDGGKSKDPAPGVQVVILDEADKMLSLGFEQQLTRLHSMVLPAPQEAATATEKGTKKKQKKTSKNNDNKEEAPAAPRPQVMLFTATMPAEVQSAASTWLSRSAEEVVISHSAASISKTITQVVQVCAEHKKPAKLLKHLSAIKDKSTHMRNPPRVLVFANRIKTVRFIHNTVTEAGYRCVMLHGQRTQYERDEAMTAFRSGKSQVLVATDVAARGLDVRLLPYVVNYDFPGSLATYIHRVGRTGRLAAYGHAYSFFTRNLAVLAAPVIDLLQQHGQSVDPNLIQLADTWKQAEEKLGPEGAAAAARRLAAMDQQSAPDAAVQDGDGDEDDDEGDGAKVVEDHDADARLEADDLLEGLGSGKGSKKSGNNSKASAAAAADDKHDDSSIQGGAAAKSHTALLKGANKKQESRKRAAGAVPDNDDDNGLEGDGAGPSFQQRLKRAKAEGVAEAQARDAAAAVTAKDAKSGNAPFIAAKVFQGAKKGYAFKKGPQGVGYYIDKPPQTMNKATIQQITKKSTGPIIPIGPQSGKKKSNADRFDSSSDEDSDVDFSGSDDEDGGKGQKQPLGSAAAASDSDDDSDDHDGVPVAQSKQTNAGKAKGTAAAAQNGVAKQSKQKQQQQKPNVPSSDDDSDSDKGAGGGNGKGKKKALPGRLRKKLAKQRANQGNKK